MPPATTETRRASTLPTMRWPTRAAMLASWRRINSTAAPAMPPLEFTQHGAGRHLGGALAGVKRDVFAGVADNGARGGLAVAGADERLEAGERRLGRVLAGEFHLLADLVADADGELLERGLDGVGAIDTLGDGGGQLLRLLLVGERLQQVAPARLLADLLDGEVDAVIDDLVHADASPLVADRGAIVDIGDAGLQGAHGDGLDGRLEGASSRAWQAS